MVPVLGVRPVGAGDGDRLPGPIEGSVVPLVGAPVPTAAAIEAVLPQFLGAIQQRPPAHSAVKVAGRRAYQLARQGKPVELALRTVAIHGIKLRRFAYPELELQIDCGSGTYVRSLGRDIAAALGTAAVMSQLQRTAVGRFRIDDALDVDALSADSMGRALQPPLAAVADLPQIGLDARQIAEIRFGRPIAIPIGEREVPSSTELAGVDSGGELVAILAEKRLGELWPICNFAC